MTNSNDNDFKWKKAGLIIFSCFEFNSTMNLDISDARAG